MRKIFLSLLAFFFAFSTFGQTNNHFQQLNSSWYVVDRYPHGSIEYTLFVERKTTIYELLQDTTINSNQWFEIFATQDSVNHTNQSSKGYIRYQNELVLYRDSLGNIDTLYDFTLSIGDSILYNRGAPDETWLELIEIDSIQLNGVYYKKYKLADDYTLLSPGSPYDDIWIEGIGSIHGVLFPLSAKFYSFGGPYSITLSCSFSQGQHVYGSNNNSDCFQQHVLSVKHEQTLNFKVYPNPFMNILTIKRAKGGAGEITIFDCRGKVVRNFKTNTKTISINGANLQQGLYFIQLTDESGTSIQKLMKQ